MIEAEALACNVSLAASQNSGRLRPKARIKAREATRNAEPGLTPQPP
jgi:hypothetical protein